MDRFEELKNYKQLLDSGVITQEEFDAIKKRFLSGEYSQPDPSNIVFDAGETIGKFRSGVKENSEKFVSDYKAIKSEGFKSGMKKMSAGTAVITAVIACIIIVAVIVAASMSKKPYSSSYSSNYSSGLSESEIEFFAKYAVIDEIKKKQSGSSPRWDSDIDPDSCWINVNTYDRDDDNITVYGTVHLKDKYGNYSSKYSDGSGDSSVNFKVVLSKSGRAESCHLD